MIKCDGKSMKINGGGSKTGYQNCFFKKLIWLLETPFFTLCKWGVRTIWFETGFMIWEKKINFSIDENKKSIFSWSKKS